MLGADAATAVLGLPRAGRVGRDGRPDVAAGQGRESGERGRDAGKDDARHGRYLCCTRRQGRGVTLRPHRAGRRRPRFHPIAAREMAVPRHRRRAGTPASPPVRSTRRAPTSGQRQPVGSALLPLAGEDVGAKRRQTRVGRSTRCPAIDPLLDPDRSQPLVRRFAPPGHPSRRAGMGPDSPRKGEGRGGTVNLTSEPWVDPPPCGS